MGLLIDWLVLSVAVWVTAAILPGVHLRSFGSAFGVAAIFGLLSWAIGWLLWTVLAIGTLGLALVLAFVTRWIVNAILLIVTDKLSDALEIDSVGWALGAGMLMSILGTAGQRLIG
ncbi:MAG: phage holin family protein [Longimicrobiales bacterium]|nr:phage holin family protein [Longimicrobiales bacterium]